MNKPENTKVKIIDVKPTIMKKALFSEKEQHSIPY